jgi:hypothetical protein
MRFRVERAGYPGAWQEGWLAFDEHGEPLGELFTSWHAAMSAVQFQITPEPCS